MHGETLKFDFIYSLCCNTEFKMLPKHNIFVCNLC